MLEHTPALFGRSELNGNIIMKENAPQKQNELHTMQRLMRYLSPQIAEIVLKCPTEASLWESHRQEVTIVVLDLCGFTRFANNVEPEEVMAVLRNYHAEMGRLVFKFHGTLERFTGDGMIFSLNEIIPIEEAGEKGCDDGARDA